MEVIRIDTKKDLIELFEWKDKNKDLVRSVEALDTNGMIMIEGKQFLHFKYLNDNWLLLKYYTLDDKVLEFKYNLKTWAVKDVYQTGIFTKVFGKDANLNRLLEDCITLYATSVAFKKYQKNINNRG